jgi:hypothetical protein
VTLQSQSLPFGMRQVRLTPYTDVSATALAAFSVALPMAQVFSFTETEDFEELRGDDRLQTSHGKGPQIDWELTAGGIVLEAYQVLAGGSAPIVTGTTPNQVKTFRKLVTDQRVPFKVEGRAISDNGGDMHAIVYRAKTTGDIAGSFEDGKFFLTNAKGTGYASLISPIDAVYDFVQNETPVVIS